MPKQIQYALDNGIPLILWIGEDEVAQGVVKVKSLNQHEEFVLKRDEMIPKIKELIAANPELLPQALQAAEGKKEWLINSYLLFD